MQSRVALVFISLNQKVHVEIDDLIIEPLIVLESGDSHGSETTERDREPSTVVALKECLSPEEREKWCSEEKYFTEKKAFADLQLESGT